VEKNLHEWIIKDKMGFLSLTFKKLAEMEFKITFIGFL
jgi:hypothetical protein